MKGFKTYKVNWLHLLFIVLLWSLTFVLFVALMNYRPTPIKETMPSGYIIDGDTLIMESP